MDVAMGMFRLTRQRFHLCPSRTQACWKGQDNSYPKVCVTYFFGGMEITFPERFTLRLGFSTRASK
jgi:hypothetical protein